MHDRRVLVWDRSTFFGAWRSSVARLLWEQEVPGSNPGAPTALTRDPATRYVSAGFFRLASGRTLSRTHSSYFAQFGRFTHHPVQRCGVRLLVGGFETG